MRKEGLYGLDLSEAEQNLRGEIAELAGALEEERTETNRLRRKIDDSQKILLHVRDSLEAHFVGEAIDLVDNLIEDLDLDV